MSGRSWDDVQEYGERCRGLQEAAEYVESRRLQWKNSVENRDRLIREAVEAGDLGVDVARAAGVSAPHVSRIVNRD